MGEGAARQRQLSVATIGAMAEGLTSEGIERLHVTAAQHVGDTLVPGLVALVATRDLVVVVLTQRMFETSQAPQVHSDIQAAAYAALA